MASDSPLGADKGLVVSERRNTKLGVRVRGIYATALTELFEEKSIQIADPTSAIKNRFPGLKTTEVAAVTVKDREDGHGLVILGLEQLYGSVLRAIREEIKWIVVKESEYGYFASLKCKVVSRVGEKYEVLLPNGEKGLLYAKTRLSRDELVTAHVIAPLASPPVLRQGLAVTGMYARLIEGGKVSFSRFIRDPLVIARLSALSEKVLKPGWGVRWRSNAAKGDLEGLLAELTELMHKAEKLKRKADDIDEPSLLSPGEKLAITLLPLQAKLLLDKVRSKRLHTIAFHHHLKTLGNPLPKLVDLVEEHFTCCEKYCLGNSLLSYALSPLKGSSKAVILHEKIEGDIIRFRGKVTEAEDVIAVEREIKSSGVYDGLGIPKEIGDKVVTYIAPFSPITVHMYFSKNGDLKGIYVNINTPIEIDLWSKPGWLKAWYVDLEVDVIAINGAVKILDSDKLMEMQGSGKITEELARWALGIAGEVKERLETDTNYLSLKDLTKEHASEVRKKFLVSMEKTTPKDDA